MAWLLRMKTLVLRRRLIDLNLHGFCS